MSKVLVVEDDPTLRWLMAEAVEHLGYGVTECASADEALGVLERAKSFALLITDVRMPGSIDGLGLAKIVWLTRPDSLCSSSQATPNCPLVSCQRIQDFSKNRVPLTDSAAP